MYIFAVFYNTVAQGAAFANYNPALYADARGSWSADERKAQ